MTEKEKKVWTEILELYRDTPCLWDTSNSNYLNRDMRNQAMDVLLTKYKLIDEDANMPIFKKKMENKRTTYNRELKKVKDSMRTGAGSGDIYVPSLWYYDLLTFLEEKSEPSRAGRDTFNSSDEESTPPPVKRAQQLPPKKKQRTSLLTHQEELYDTHNNSRNTAEEWEIIGKSIGLQMKDLDKRQQAIAQKLISDTIFYAKIGKLTEDSSISLSPYPISPSPPSQHSLRSTTSICTTSYSTPSP